MNQGIFGLSLFYKISWVQFDSFAMQFRQISTKCLTNLLLKITILNLQDTRYLNVLQFAKTASSLCISLFLLDFFWSPGQPQKAMRHFKRC